MPTGNTLKTTSREHAPDTTVIGNRGEDLAVDYLHENGFSIVARNWRSGHLEVDIIATRHETLHFIEVKTRGSGSWISPEDAFDGQKRRAVIKAVNRYVELYGVECEVQIDLVAIELHEAGRVDIRYYPDVANIHW